MFAVGGSSSRRSSNLMKIEIQSAKQFSAAGGWRLWLRAGGSN